MRNLLNPSLQILRRSISLNKPFSRYKPIGALALIALVSIGGIHLARVWAAGAISLTTIGVAYTQNFDTLANAGTSSVVPPGWGFAEAGGDPATILTPGPRSRKRGGACCVW